MDDGCNTRELELAVGKVVVAYALEYLKVYVAYKHWGVRNGMGMAGNDLGKFVACCSSLGLA